MPTGLYLPNFQNCATSDYSNLFLIDIYYITILDYKKTLYPVSKP